ncbi:MAG TPA: DsrE family protein [Verrucomicrobiae bacterium]|jgi:sulfur relay (sulfurtransferase) complex TusBCD TusD component (DsrE family)
MSLRGKKLGLLLSTRPDQPGFRHGLRLAEAALSRGLRVYLYCIDDAVCGLADAQLQSLKARGLNLYACAYGAQRRNIPVSDCAVFSGLAVVSDLMAGTDRFLSFN